MKRVSIIEDQTAIAKSIGRTIERSPDLELASIYHSAEAAIAGLIADRVDIVLMDIGLPKMNGIDCMLRLKELQPGLRFLMFTVFDDDDKLFDSLRLGADGYILKSDGLIGVMKALKELLVGGAPMSRGIAKKVLFSLREPQKVPQAVQSLTPRQNEILNLIAEGLPNKEIAARLDLSEGTVKQHNYKIFKVLQVNNRTEARNRLLTLKKEG